MSHRLLTYRGLMTSSTQEQLRLRSIKGENGYRIVKFELMPNTNIIYFESLEKLS